MTTYTTITNALVAVGAKPFATTIQALRDNPLAIAEGDVTAPKILDAALSTTVTADGINWVSNRNAGASAGAVGTYAFANGGAADVAFGSTVAGSSLSPVSAARSWSASTNALGSVAFTLGSALSGTWRAMGTYDLTNAAGGGGPVINGATLWLRIS